MTPSSRWTRVEVAILAGIVALGVLLRTGAAVLLPSPLESDYLGYWTLATNLYQGSGLADEAGHPTAFLSLGYPILLWIGFHALGPTIAAVKTMNVALGGATILLVYVATRGLFRSTVVAALAAVLVATYVEAIAYTAYVAKENLMNVLVTAQLALVAGELRRRRLYLNGALFGLATGFLAIAGNAGIGFLPGMALQAAFAIRNRAGIIQYGVIALFFAGLAVAPLVWRNHVLFGAYVLNNNAGFNLYIGNNPNATPYFQSITETPIGKEASALRSLLGERGYDVRLRELALQHIRAHPLETLGLALRKGAVFWTPPFHSGRDGRDGVAERMVRLAWLIEYCLICALFVAGLILCRGHGRAFAVLGLLVVGYTAVHMVFYVIFRYRLPVMPFLCIGGGAGTYLLINVARKRALGPAAVLARTEKVARLPDA